MAHSKGKLLVGSIIAVFVVWLAYDLSAGWLTGIQGIPAGDYYLNSFQLWSAQRKANDGDLHATRRLYEYYSTYKLDEAKAAYWMKRAAELGDQQYQKLIPRNGRDGKNK